MNASEKWGSGMTTENNSFIKETKEGLLMQIRVQPRASRNNIRVEGDGIYRISVTSPPVDDAANNAICAYLAKLLGVAKSNISIAGGVHSRTKTVCIANIDKKETINKLHSQIKG